MGAREQVLAQITRYAHPVAYHDALAQHYRRQGEHESARYHQGHELNARRKLNLVTGLALDATDISSQDAIAAYKRGRDTGRAQAQRVISVATAA